MSDPLDKATSRAPATLGEGCLSRYDPDALDAEDGTDFPGAARLWEQTQAQDQPPAAPEKPTPPLPPNCCNLILG